MMTLIFLIFVMNIMSLLFPNNPTKTSINVTLASLTAFMSMAFTAGSYWFPILFFMVFTGGILMMFMILSSLSPNEKFTQGKYLLMSTNLTMATLMSQSSTMKKGLSEIKMLSWLMGSSNLIFLIVVLMIYFLTFILMADTKGLSLKSNFCWKELIL